MGGESCQFADGARTEPEGGGDAKAMSGKGEIGAVEELPKDRGEREEIQRVRPPDAAHDMAINVCPLNLSAVREQKAQVVQQPLIWQIQPPAHPLALKGCNLEAVPIERGGP